MYVMLTVFVQEPAGRLGLGVVDLTDGAEVPLPIIDSSLRDVETPTASVAGAISRSSSSRSKGKSSSPVPPAISISKPPAPLPVDLPSPLDIQERSFDDSRRTSFDLEAARDLSIDDVEHPLSSESIPVKSPNPRIPVANSKNLADKEASFVPIRKPVSIPSSRPVPDLLQNDSAEGVGIVPIVPAKSPVDRPAEAIVTESTPADDEQIPEDTIRLVGGKGISGVVPESDPVGGATPELTADGEDLASVASVDSISTPPKAVVGRHEKKSSFSGLKKIGKLGSRRRSSSSSSTAAKRKGTTDSNSFKDKVPS